MAEADRLIASTADEARELITLYGADPKLVDTVPPGVDLEMFTPGSGGEVRRSLGIGPDEAMLLFVGRIQPLKAPDVLLRAAAKLPQRVHVVIVGAPSGTGLAEPKWLEQLAWDLGLGNRVHFVPPVARVDLAGYYRAADLTVVPSYSESFGLVALESQSCGTPVVAAAVGGLPTAVGTAGVLVGSHDPLDWSLAIEAVLNDPVRRANLAVRARPHAMEFSWERTTGGLLASYTEAAESMAPRFDAGRRP